MHPWPVGFANGGRGKVHFSAIPLSNSASRVWEERSSAVVLCWSFVTAANLRDITLDTNAPNGWAWAIHLYIVFSLRAQREAQAAPTNGLEYKQPITNKVRPPKGYCLNHLDFCVYSRWEKPFALNNGLPDKYPKHWNQIWAKRAVG